MSGPRLGGTVRQSIGTVPDGESDVPEAALGRNLVDFHCHLDLYPDHAGAVATCERARVRTLAVTTTPRAWPRNREITEGTRYVRAALGLHPQLVGERVAELPLWEQYLPQARYVGEIGLDASPRFFRTLDLQKTVFTHMLRACARVGDRVLSVHSVRTAGAVLDHIAAHLPPTRGRVVLHWFTGTLFEARRAADLGCYFSINAEMLRSERHLALIDSLPLERVLTETDGPFTAAGDRPATPADVGSTVLRLADARGMDPATLAAAIHDNLRRLLPEAGLAPGS